MSAIAADEEVTPPQQGIGVEVDDVEAGVQRSGTIGERRQGRAGGGAEPPFRAAQDRPSADPGPDGTDGGERGGGRCGGGETS